MLFCWKICCFCDLLCFVARSVLLQFTRFSVEKNCTCGEKWQISGMLWMKCEHVCNCRNRNRGGRTLGSWLVDTMGANWRSLTAVRQPATIVWCHTIVWCGATPPICPSARISFTKALRCGFLLQPMEKSFCVPSSAFNQNLELSIARPKVLPKMPLSSFYNSWFCVPVRLEWA